MERSGDDLLADLEYLRKHAGATATRLGDSGNVTLALGQADDPAELKLQRLISAINSLDGEQAELLLYIFGLADKVSGVKSLIKRREIYGRKVGRKVDTIAERENQRSKSCV